MPKLFAFGDSFTQGVGLSEETKDPVNSTPSKLAWPQLVADLLGYECVNLGLGGGSYKEVAYFMSIHQHEIAQEDIVAIMWTNSIDRTCTIADPADNTSHRGIHQYGPWSLGDPDTPHYHIARTLLAECGNTENTMFEAGAYMKTANGIATSQTTHVLNLTNYCVSNARDYINTNNNTIGPSTHNVADQPWVGVQLLEQFGLYDPTITPIYTEYDSHLSAAQHAHYSKKLAKYIQENFLTK